MGEEIRTVCFDSELMVEAYQLEGIMQRFPNHFHDDYVIGFIEKGQRLLSCKNRQYRINPGDLIIFNPGDSHTCEQADNETLDYRLHDHFRCQRSHGTRFHRQHLCNR